MKQFNPPTPGEHLLEDFMKPLHLSAGDLFISESDVEGILAGTIQITEEMSKILGIQFDLSDLFFFNLQKNYNESLTPRESCDILVKNDKKEVIMDSPRILFFDIEVSPCTGWFWRTGKQNVGAHQLIEAGKIICISFRFADWKPGRIESLVWDESMDDKKMLKDFTTVAEAADIIIGHNGENFDVRWVNARIAYHKLPRLDIISTEDTYRMIKRKLYLPSYKLEYLCRYFEIGRKLSTATGLWQAVAFDNNRKALADMVTYCENDVLVLAELDARVSDYVDRKVNRSIYSGAGTCPQCGGSNLHKNGHFVTRTGKFQRLRCLNCGKSSKTSHNLIQSGGYLR